MLDIKLIRDQPDVVRKNLKKRRDPTKLELLEKLIREDVSYRELLKDVETFYHRRNLKTEEIRKRKEEGESIEKYRKEMQSLLEKMKETEKLVEEKKAAIDLMLLKIPNLLHDSVPSGKDDTENAVVKKWGKIPSMSFALRGHEEIGAGLGILDIERAAKISGARFYFLKNEGVLLDMALQRMALDFLMKKGFAPVQPPLMMRRKPYEGVVDLSDFEEVMYKTEHEDLYFIATSEHPLTAQFSGETILEETLPLKLAGVSPCFRKEAGSHGKDTKGIFRVHHFNKVEQIVLCKPEDSWHIHEELLKNAEELFQLLELPYRVVNVCTGDIGSIAAKKYDVEVWMPVQGKYREMVSCSNATDYQARRLGIKYGKKSAGATGLIHTLNSTALVTRALVALLENYQQRDGSVLIPKALVPYMNGIKKIEQK